MAIKGNRVDCGTIADTNQDYEQLASLIAEKLIELNRRKNNVLISLDQACKVLAKSRSTFWRWAQVGYLKPIKISARVFFKEEDINMLKEGKLNIN